MTVDYNDLVSARDLVRKFGNDPTALTETSLVDMRRMVPGVKLANVRKSLRQAVDLIHRYEVENSDIADKRVYTLADMRKLPRRVPVVDKLLQTDTLAWLTGHPGSGKSAAAVGLSLAVCLGRPWLGHITAPGSVFYMAGEGFHDLVDRADAYLQHHDVEEPDNLHVFTDAVELADPVAVSDLLTSHLQPISDLRLLVIDTQYVYYTGSEVDAGSAEAYVRGLQTLRRETGACILSLHHINAAGAPRGSTVFAGAADNILRVDTVKSRHDRAVLHSYKARGIPPFADVPLAFTSQTVRVDDTTGSPVTAPVLDRATDATPADETTTAPYRAYEVLQGLPDQKAASGEWQDACAAVGITGGSFDRAVRALLKDGTVTKEEGLRGRYAAADL